MSDFVALVGVDPGASPQLTTESLDEAFRHCYGAGVRQVASGLWARDEGPRPLTLATSGDQRSWLVIKGILFDVEGSPAAIDVDALFGALCDAPSLEAFPWRRYEGWFALAFWDARRGRGVAINDQTSGLNLYHTSVPQGLVACTNAVPVARALGRGFAAAALQQVLFRGPLITPMALFEGFARVDVGEAILADQAGHRAAKVWDFPDRYERWSFSEAVARLAERGQDRIRRFSKAAGGRLLLDLTGGYDSRLLASTTAAAGVDFEATVNGFAGDTDREIAIRVARAAGWSIRVYDNDEWRQTVLDDTLRRELSLRGHGELPARSLYHQRLTRPALGETFAMHATGIGGEFVRYHPWGSELHTLGRRRRANVDRLLRYRFVAHADSAGELLTVDIGPQARQRLRSMIVAHMDGERGLRNTQQLDRVHAWKQTGHGTLWHSASSNWLLSTSPQMGAGFLDVALRVPWPFRVTTALNRALIAHHHARAAEVETAYGASAAPLRWDNATQHLRQLVARGGHLARKLDKVALGGRLGLAAPPSAAPREIPFDVEALRALLDPRTMATAALYEPVALRRFVAGLPERSGLAMRLAALEDIARAIRHQPSATLLSDG